MRCPGCLQHLIGGWFPHHNWVKGLYGFQQPRDVQACSWRAEEKVEDLLAVEFE